MRYLNIIKKCILFFILFNATVYSSSFQLADKVSNTLLRSKISIRFAQNDLLSADKINIDVSDGNVVLTGAVKTENEFSQAVMIAQSVPDVKTVSAEYLTVNSSTKSLTDITLLALIKGVFMQQKIFGATTLSLWPIRIEVSHQTIEFSGIVDSESQKNDMIKFTQPLCRTCQIITTDLKINPPKKTRAI